MQLFKAASKAALEFMQLNDAIACDYRVAEEIIRAITVPVAAPANSDPAPSLSRVVTSAQKSVIKKHALHQAQDIKGSGEWPCGGGLVGVALWGM